MRQAEATGLKDVAIPCAACFARFEERNTPWWTLRWPRESRRSRAAPCPATSGSCPYADPERALSLRESPSRRRAAPDGAEARALLRLPADPPSRSGPFRRSRGPADTRSAPAHPRGRGRGLAREDRLLRFEPGPLRTEVVLDLPHQLLAWAEEAGADAIATACPMCHSNLDMRQGQAGKGKTPSRDSRSSTSRS